MTMEQENARQAFMDSLVGTVVGGRYVIERILGYGGMGLVVQGRHPELEQQVAIKLMWPEGAANAMLNARFLREAKVAAQVFSPHLVRVFDVGRLPSGIPYMAMEMLKGRDLADELAERGPLPQAEAVDYVLQAIAGIAEMHARGIVHRDLKPANLFLAEGAGTRTLKVLDFGVSKDSLQSGDSALTSVATVVGTPHYMSPEQIKMSAGVDVRSDIWSLGVIAFELLTGELPFRSESNSVGEIFGLILHTDPPRAGRLRPDLSPKLEDVLAVCMRRSREERYASVAQLAEALKEFTDVGSLHRVEATRRALLSQEFAEAIPRPADDVGAPRPVSAGIVIATEPRYSASLQDGSPVGGEEPSKAREDAGARPGAAFDAPRVVASTHENAPGALGSAPTVGGRKAFAPAKEGADARATGTSAEGAVVSARGKSDSDGPSDVVPKGPPPALFWMGGGVAVLGLLGALMALRSSSSSSASAAQAPPTETKSPAVVSPVVPPSSTSQAMAVDAAAPPAKVSPGPRPRTPSPPAKTHGSGGRAETPSSRPSSSAPSAPAGDLLNLDRK